MADVLKQLGPLSFRGIVVPIVNRQVGFSHEIAKHKFQFRDDVHPEPTGRGELTFRYTLPMYEGVARGPYKHLFIVTLPKLWEAMLDRKPGPLNDPMHGAFDAQPVSYSETLDVARRDGVSVEIDFIHAPKLDDAIVAGAGLAGVKAISTDLDALAASVVKQPWFQEIHEQVELDLLTGAAAALDQINLAGEQAASKLDKVAFQMDQLSDSIEPLADPATWPFLDAIQNTKDSALQLKDRAGDPARNMVKYTLDAEATITTIAAKLGVSAEDLMALNEEIAAGGPMVPKGTIVIYEAE